MDRLKSEAKYKNYFVNDEKEPQNLPCILLIKLVLILKTLSFVGYFFSLFFSPVKRKGTEIVNIQPLLKSNLGIVEQNPDFISGETQMRVIRKVKRTKDIVVKALKGSQSHFFVCQIDHEL